MQIGDHNKTANSSSHHDSEYDTASDTPSSDDELLDDDHVAIVPAAITPESEISVGEAAEGAAPLQSDEVDDDVDVGVDDGDLVLDEDDDDFDDDGVEDDDEDGDEEDVDGDDLDGDEDDEDDDDGLDDDLDDDDDDDDEDTVDEDGNIVLDLERQRGDGEEGGEGGEPVKKVDHDEDRSNPQYIPKRGVFYEHDDRTADEPYVL